MDLKLMQRFLPYAAIAIVTAFSLWLGKSERTDNSEDGDGEEVSSSGGSEFEVFLGFRGEDTRNSFTGHLYESLHYRGVSTFIDSEKLEKGEKMDKLLEYIEKSKICRLQMLCGMKMVFDKEIILVFFGVELPMFAIRVVVSNQHSRNMNPTR
ncbi:unnamed protein product [Victoria cruziana]